MKQASLEYGKTQSRHRRAAFGFSGVCRSPDGRGWSAHYRATRTVPAFTLLLVFMAALFIRFDLVVSLQFPATV